MSGDSYTNQASGYACVGAQIGKQVGDTYVHMNSSRDGSARITAIEKDLAAVREELIQLYENGQLGEQAYVSADEGLQEAEGLAGQATGKRSRLISILERVHRVLADVADLGSKVASILSAVHRL